MSRFRLATYNIHFGTSESGALVIDEIIKVLKYINADIAALQEVDDLRPRSRLTRQAQYLARCLDMGYVYGIVKRFRNGSYGNVVLSRFPIISMVNHLLPDSKDPRRCLQVNLVINQQIVTVLNTHLALSQSARWDNLNQIILPLVESVTNPLVLTGDFNSTPERADIALVSSKLNDTFNYNTRQPAATFPAREPKHRIDYIFVNHQLNVQDCCIIDQPASDHLPVVADMNLINV